MKKGLITFVVSTGQPKSLNFFKNKLGAEFYAAVNVNMGMTDLQMCPFVGIRSRYPCFLINC